MKTVLDGTTPAAATASAKAYLASASGPRMPAAIFLYAVPTVFSVHLSPKIAANCELPVLSEAAGYLGRELLQ